MLPTFYDHVLLPVTGLSFWPFKLWNDISLSNNLLLSSCFLIEYPIVESVPCQHLRSIHLWSMQGFQPVCEVTINVPYELWLALCKPCYALKVFKTPFTSSLSCCWLFQQQRRCGLFSSIFFLVSWEGLARCFVETKSYEFALEVDVPIFWIFEQSWGFMCSIATWFPSMECWLY